MQSSFDDGRNPSNPVAPARSVAHATPQQFYDHTVFNDQHQQHQQYYQQQQQQAPYGYNHQEQQQQRQVDNRSYGYSQQQDAAYGYPQQQQGQGQGQDAAYAYSQQQNYQNSMNGQQPQHQSMKDQQQFDQWSPRSPTSDKDALKSSIITSAKPYFPPDPQGTLPPPGHLKGPGGVRDTISRVKAAKDRNCCCRGWRCCGWTVLVFLLICLAVFLFVVFYGVRIPKVSIVDISQDPNFPQNGFAPPFDRFSVGLIVNATVQNDNFFSLLFDQLEVQTYDNAYNSGKTALSAGQLGSSSSRVKIESNAVTTILIPQNLTYDTTVDSDKSYLHYLVGQCVSGSKIKIKVKVWLHFTLISFAKYAPEIDTDASFGCPFDVAGLGGIPIP